MWANVLTDWQKLEYKEVPKPSPKTGEALIEVIYAGICGSDVTVFNHHHPTATIPRIMCHEILGTVREINSDKPVDYKVGDRVVVYPMSYCGECEICRNGNFHVCGSLKIMGLHSEGGFAEFVCAAAEKVFAVSPDLPDRVAILNEPLAVGYHAHMRAGTVPGDDVLIIGAGPIGLLCAMAARYFEAGKVVVTEVNPERVALARSFGFDVIDSANADVVAEVNARTGGMGFDKVFECSGAKAASLTITDVTKIRGVVVPLGIGHEPIAYKTNMLTLKEISLVGSRVHTLQDFGRTVTMLERIHARKLYDLEKMIAATYPLSRLAEALEVQMSGKLHGKILMDVRGGK